MKATAPCFCIKHQNLFHIPNKSSLTSIPTSLPTNDVDEGWRSLSKRVESVSRKFWRFHTNNNEFELECAIKSDKD